MKILVLSSYTKGQQDKPDNCIRFEDLDPPARLRSRINELSDCGYGVPAGKMFTGPLHPQLRKGLNQIREHDQYGETTLDLYFPSNYFRADGEEHLVHEEDIIVPFDVEPQDDIAYSETELSELSDRVEALMEQYDLVFSLMEKYNVRRLENLFQNQRKVTLILLAAPSWGISIPEPSSNTYLVCTGAGLAEKLDGANTRNLRGVVFRKLCEAAYRDGFHVFKQVKQDPQRLIEIVLRGQ